MNGTELAPQDMGKLSAKEWDDTRKVLAEIVKKIDEAFGDKDIAIAVVAWKPEHPNLTSYMSTRDRPESKKALKKATSRL